MNRFMRGSIPIVTIPPPPPPPGHTPGDLPFFSSLGVLFPTDPGHKERGNSPSPGHSTASCTVSQEDRNIYYFYNIEGKITEC